MNQHLPNYNGFRRRRILWWERGHTSVSSNRLKNWKTLYFMNPKYAVAFSVTPSCSLWNSHFINRAKQCLWGSWGSPDNSYDNAHQCSLNIFNLLMFKLVTGGIKSVTCFVILWEIMNRPFLGDCKRQFLSETKVLRCLSIVSFCCMHALWLKPVFS